MVLHKTTDRVYRSLIKNLHEAIRRAGCDVSLSQTHESFARSQGFSDHSEFCLAAFPRWVNVTSTAYKRFAQRVAELSTSEVKLSNFNTNLLAKIVEGVSPTPFIAPPNHGLAFFIDWDDGFVYSPHAYHEGQNGLSWPEYYGQREKFRLPSAVTIGEFNALENELAELIKSVTAGYSYNGAETHSTFSADAESAREKIREIVEYFEFQETEKYGCEPALFYGDDGITSTDIYSLEIVELVNPRFPQINWQTSDKELAEFVAYALDGSFCNVNETALFEYFVELRDACRQNQKALLTPA